MVKKKIVTTKKGGVVAAGAAGSGATKGAKAPAAVAAKKTPASAADGGKQASAQQTRRPHLPLPHLRPPHRQNAGGKASQQPQASREIYKFAFCVIYPKLENALIRALYNSGAKYCVHVSAQSSAPRSLLNFLGLSNTKRSTLLALFNVRDEENVKLALNSIYTKQIAGISMICDIDAYIGLNSVFGGQLQLLEVENG